MDQATRIALITETGTHLGWSQAVTSAIGHYLSGAGTLAQVDEAWQSFKNRGLLNGVWHIRFFSDDQAGPLDALDLRLLDLFEHFGAFRDFLLRAVVARDVVAQIADHLRSHGLDEQAIRQRFFDAVHAGSCLLLESNRGPDALTPLGRYLLALLPDYAQEMFNALERYSDFFRLLLLMQPPAPELVWQFAQQVMQGDVEHYDLQSVVSILLCADPARYTPWARQLASAANPLTEESRRLAALVSLMEHDPTQHIDLALEAARSPITDRYANLQGRALEMGYAFDPVRFWPVLETAAVSRNYWQGYSALKLLEKVPFAQACPVLQRCVVQAHAQIGYQALERLLTQPWAGQKVFLLMLWAHRSKRIRECAAAALKSQGATIP